MHLPDITILHIIYQQNAYEGHAKNYEFSGTSMREHGMSVEEEKWMSTPVHGAGIVVHDVHRHED